MNTSMRFWRRFLWLSCLVGFAAVSPELKAASTTARPNILFVVSDDQSFFSTSRAGYDPVVKTPGFDEVAKNGIYFTNAFCSASSCSPSRAAMLTGRNQWELKEASVISVGFPGDLIDTQDLLWQAGYYTGYTGKGWGPGIYVPLGRKINPAGIQYNAIKDPVTSTNWKDSDYAANFEQFLKDRNPGQPFSFWYSSFEPHRPYPAGSGVKAGLNPQKVFVPPTMYDYIGMREDLCDYLYAIEKYDRALVKILDILKEQGLLDNTVIFVTSDNGLPFPTGKTNLYDLGTKEPLAVMWQNHIKPGRVVDDLINLADVAPTILQLAGVPIPPVMDAKSFTNILFSDKSGIVDPSRQYVVLGQDVHDTPYPMRAIRTHDYLYIANIEPQRYKFPKENKYVWGRPQFPPETKAQHEHLPFAEFYGSYQNDPAVRPYLMRDMGPRPAEELFDVKKDPFQMHNLADQPEMAALKAQLRATMIAYLKKTSDPRFTAGAPVKFNDYAPITAAFRLANPDLFHQYAKIEKEAENAMKTENAAKKNSQPASQ